MEMLKELSNEELMSRAPSIFATAPKSDVSDRYNFLSTIDAIEMMKQNGWYPVSACEMRANKDENRGVQKHIVNLQNDNMKMSEVGDSVVQIRLVNSHNRTAAWQLHMGVFRLVCTNGMTVSDGTFGKINAKHINLDEDTIINSCEQIVKNSNIIIPQIDRMNEIELTQNDKGAYALSTLQYLYGDVTDTPEQVLEKSPVTLSGILKPQRKEDLGNDLWTIFNRVQENVIKGGVPTKKLTKRYRPIKTRKITSIDKDIKINKALWTLTETMMGFKDGTIDPATFLN